MTPADAKRAIIRALAVPLLTARNAVIDAELPDVPDDVPVVGAPGFTVGDVRALLALDIVALAASISVWT